MALPRGTQPGRGCGKKTFAAGGCRAKTWDEQPDAIAPTQGLSGHGEQARRVEIALRTLSAREQQLVILKVYEEKTYKEISEITGLSAGNVGYILHHAMKKMSQVLKQDGGK